MRSMRSFNRTRLALKLAHALPAGYEVPRFNRTRLALKRNLHRGRVVELPGFNRTRLALKREHAVRDFPEGSGL